MIQRYQQDKRMSQIVIYNGYFETAGQISLQSSANVTIQTKDALNNIDKLLNIIGANKNHLTRIQIWLKDMKDFEEMNAVYEEWLKGFDKPVRACVGSDLAEGYKVEIQAFGFKENS